MLRNKNDLPHEEVNILFNAGGLGDCIARMTVVKYLIKIYPYVTFYIYVPDYFEDLAKNLVPEARIRIFSKADKQYNVKLGARKSDTESHSTLRSHLVDQAFHVLADKQVDIEHKNYCKLRTKSINIYNFKLPEKYVVITTGYTAIVREMKSKTVNELTDYIISKGYTPVFLGNKQTEIGLPGDHLLIKGNFPDAINYSKGIDLIGKTSLLEAGKIISESKCIIGLDNGLMHLAGTTNAPIIGGFTTVEPKYRMPYRDNTLGKDFYPVVPDESLACRFCQSNWDFIYDHDFRECYYIKKEMDNEIQCTKSLTSDKFIVQLEKIL